MNRKYVVLWYLSIVMYAVAAVLFIKHMLSYEFWDTVASLGSVIGATCLMWFANKNLTYEQGYTLVTAAWFYQICKYSSIQNETVLQQKLKKAKKIAAKFETAKNLSDADIIVMFKRGYNYHCTKEKTIE